MLSVLLTLSLSQASPPPEPLTLRLDPVILVEGIECAGQEGLFVDRFGLRYHFASPVTKAAFEADPEPYEIRYGGACARMGPLSARGTTSIYAVWERGIYIFASAACRKDFLADPAAHVWTSDAAPESVDPSNAERGRALLVKAVEAHGGQEALDALTRVSLSWWFESGPRLDVHREERLDFGSREGPSTFALTSSWLHREFFSERKQTLSGGNGILETHDGAEVPMHPVQVRALAQERDRHPLGILRAAADPGAIVLARGTRMREGMEFDVVLVHHGDTSVLVDLAPDGRLGAVRYRGRGPSMRYGWKEERFLNPLWLPGGVRIPLQTEAWFDGERASALDRGPGVLNGR